MIQSNSKKEVSVDSSQRKIKLEDIAILLLNKLSREEKE